MPHDTIGNAELKSQLFTSWKKMFDNIQVVTEKKSPHSKKKIPDSNFELRIKQIFTLLTPVVSDGITTENLVMVRTRFIMDWFGKDSKKYDFPLFTYFDDLISTGHFEIYNEWLFGNAENQNQFIAWNTFHNGDIIRFEDWKKKHPFLPGAVNISYNNRTPSLSSN
jgi:hypothetical protein